MTSLLLVHVLATFFMVGLIWTVQVVHYPLFALVGRGSFASYEAAHTRRITWLLAIPALSELVTGVALVANVPPGVPSSLAVAGVVLLGVIWLSTAVVQVPVHRALAQSWTPEVGSRLVATNWIRTIGWSVRGAIVVGMLMGVT